MSTPKCLDTSGQQEDRMSIMQWIKEVLGLEGHRYGRYYVYELRDPRFSPARTFYVGKGTADRLHQHERDMRRLIQRGRAGIMRMQPKHKRILEIIDDGHQVVYAVIFRTDNEEEAYQVESRRIEHYGLEHLTNETYGYRRKTTRRKAS